MKLFEHADFGQSVLRATEHFRARGLRPAIIEKDYYATEALRIIARGGDRIIFKGGTSLAKGWNLIQRFSEDIDISLIPKPSSLRWVKTPSTGNSKNCAMPWVSTRL